MLPSHQQSKQYLDVLGNASDPAKISLTILPHKNRLMVFRIQTFIVQTRKYFVRPQRKPLLHKASKS